MDGLLARIYSQGDRAKRHLNGLLSDPIGSLEQTAGLLMDKHREHQAMQARAFSDPDRPFRLTDKKALGGMVDQMMTGPMGFAPVGMAKLVKPLGAGPHYATENLSEYTPLLYRETSANRAVDFLPNSASQPQDLWFSNEPAMAIGQGANRGVLMEFDAANIPGQLSLQKPMARQSYESGMAEFLTKGADASQIGQNLKSIRINREQQKGPYFRRIQGLLKDWSAQKEADGTIVLTRP